MTEEKKDEKKLPPTLEDLERRMAKLEEKRDQEGGLSDAEIKQLRKDYFKVKEAAHHEEPKKEEKPTEESFLDWLFG